MIAQKLLQLAMNGSAEERLTGWVGQAVPDEGQRINQRDPAVVPEFLRLREGEWFAYSEGV